MLNRAFIFIIATGILAIAHPGYAVEPDLSGRWTGTLKRGDAEGLATMVLTEGQGKTTGYLSDPRGVQMPIRNWKLAANSFEFDVEAEERGRTKMVHFVGSLRQGTIEMHSVLGDKDGPTITLHRTKQ